MAPFRGVPGELSATVARPVEGLVGPGRLELPTLRLSGVRSNHLSYGPMAARQPGDPGLAIALPNPEGISLRAGSERRKEKRRRRHPAVFYGAPIGRETWRSILRKEVIQPQVPLRLPCYDFTPVADPTVVGCLHCWLAHRLRVKPTPMV